MADGLVVLQTGPVQSADADANGIRLKTATTRRCRRGGARHRLRRPATWWKPSSRIGRSECASLCRLRLSGGRRASPVASQGVSHRSTRRTRTRSLGPQHRRRATGRPATGRSPRKRLNPSRRAGQPEVWAWEAASTRPPGMSVDSTAGGPCRYAWVRSSPLGTRIFPRPVMPNRSFSLASVWRLTEPHPSIREAHRRRVITPWPGTSARFHWVRWEPCRSLPERAHGPASCGCSSLPSSR